ncbi:MAG: DUF2203 domain-containing protein [Actinomycetota bacterium]
MAPERRYTLMEATALLGPLTRLLRELREARDVLADADRRAWIAEHAPGNGGGDVARAMAEASMTVARGIRQVETWGIVVQDLDTGICDFPSERDGRTVFLCWQEGEPRIGHWHEIGAGFRSRRPL